MIEAFSVRMDSEHLAVSNEQLTVNSDSFIQNEKQKQEDCSLRPDNSSFEILFKEMLALYEEYNPVVLEPYMENLEQILCPEQIQPIKKQLDNFEFHKAREETLKLAQALGI